MPRIATRQSRPAGEYLSSEVAAPARGQTQATVYRALLDLHADDLADPTLTMSVSLEGTRDGGATWVMYARIDGWQGGTVGRDGNISPPRLSWSADDNRVLTRMRVRWTQSKTARVGASLETEAREVSAARSQAATDGSDT